LNIDIRKNRALAAAGALLLVAAAVAPAQNADRPPRVLDTAGEFVSAARDLGLRVAGRQTPGDVLEIRALLEAATRIRPEASEPWMWTYELAMLRGDAEAATAAIDKLLETDPANESVWRLWVGQIPAAANTIEGRARRLTERLAKSPPPPLAGLIHVALARVALERLDPDGARQHFEEAAARCPDCPEVALLAMELMSPTGAPLERLRTTLNALRLHPLQPELAWDAGAILDEAGFADEALRFYEYAQSIAGESGQPLPMTNFRMLQLSYNALGRGDVRAAIDFGLRSARQLANSLEPLFYLFWLTDRYVGREQANAIAAQARRYFERMDNPAAWPANLVAQAAWYYATIEIDPPRALSLIQSVLEREGSDPFVRRVHGWALSINGQLEEAAAVLEPLRREDPYAAVRLAMNRRAVGDDAGAQQILAGLERIPPVGPARDLLDKQGLPAAASQPAAERQPRIAQALEEFGTERLEFHREPGKYVEATIRPLRSAVEPGEPWMFEFALTNRGPFVVSLGPGGMINPVFLVSVTLDGDKKLTFAHLVTVSVDRKCVLQPAERVSAVQQIDFGALRTTLDQTPQRLWRATVTATLDPVQAPDGTWDRSPLGQALGPVYLNRAPAGVTDQAWHARFSQLTGDSPHARLLALEQIGLLLGEAQRARLGRLSYEARAIPEQRVAAVLRASLESADWEIRARTLMALSHAGLDQALVDAVRGRLHDDHWAVRLLALRLLGRLGAGFAPDAKRIADEDTDPLVQSFAALLADRLDQPAGAGAADAPQTGVSP